MQLDGCPLTRVLCLPIPPARGNTRVSIERVRDGTEWRTAQACGVPCTLRYLLCTVQWAMDTVASRVSGSGVCSAVHCNTPAGYLLYRENLHD